MGETDANGGAPAIETHGLTKRFGERVALAEANLHVPRGIAFGFLGPKGVAPETQTRY